MSSGLAYFILTNVFSIIEGTREALERLRLDYVDVIFAHRHDFTGINYSYLTDKTGKLIVQSSSYGGDRAGLQLGH